MLGNVGGLKYIFMSPICNFVIIPAGVCEDIINNRFKMKKIKFHGDFLNCILSMIKNSIF
ncbi:hypothetical protein DVF26_10260 [Salmonella enterica subsp. enterica]|nr:hypothetical protein [Salmonella enterica subsp. enterica]